MKRVLTVKGVESARPKATRYEVPDVSLPCFYLSVMPSGHKSFCVRFRVNGIPKRLGLGSYPQITLEAARKAAREALGKVALGEDPAEEKKAKRHPGAATGNVPKTIDELIKSFTTRYVE